MASEIRANKSTNRAGLGTVTYADTGIIVSGIVTCTELSGLTALNISGVGTASTLDINGDIDVDGHTNLDNVSIAGVSTFTGNVRINDNAGLTANANADNLIVGESTGNHGITILSGTGGAGNLFFGDSDNTSAAGFQYTHGDNSMRFRVAGVERLRIDSSGRVLIGTTTEGHSNADDLTIATSGDTGITIRSGTTHNGRIYFSDATSGAGEVVGSLDYDHNDNKFSIHTNGGERLRIDSSGRLLLGTDTEGHPNADDLTIATSGDTGITIRSGTSNNGRIYFSDATSGSGEVVGSLDYDHDNDSFSIYTGGGLRLHITSGGTVGINDSTPNTYFKLDVNGHTNIVGDIALPTTNRIYFGNSDTAFIKGEHGGSGYLAFGANNEKMRLTRAGYLGIGTDNPQVQLNVVNPTTLGGTESNRQDLARFEGNVSNDGMLEFANVRLSNGSDWQTSTFRIQRRIDSTRMGYIDFGTGAGAGAAGAGRDIQFGSGDGVTMMHLDSQGSVGLGTVHIATNKKLDVCDGIISIQGTGSHDSRIEFLRPNTNAMGWIGVPNWSDTSLYIFGPTATGNEVAAAYGSGAWNFYTSGGSNAAKLTIDTAGLTTLKNFNGTGLRLQGSGGDYQGMQLQVTDSSSSQTRNVFIDVVNETGAAIANQVGQIQSDGGSHWAWQTQPSGNRNDRRVERLRLDSDGTVILKNTAAATSRSDFLGSLRPISQIASTWNAYHSLTRHDSGSSYGPYLMLAKNRNDTYNSNGIVQDNDELGNIAFLGNDGSVFREGARIRGEVDGTPGSNQMPTALTFATSNGSGVGERLRITKDGDILINTNTINAGGATPKLSIDGGDSNIGVIQVQAGGGETTGDLAGISFSHGVTGDMARPKAAIAFNRNESYGRGDLCFYVDNTTDNNTVSSGDLKLTISRAGSVVVQNGNIDFNTQGTGIFYNPGGNDAAGITFHSNEVKFYTQNTHRFSLDTSGYLRFKQQLFIRNNAPTIYLQDTDHHAAMIHQNSGLFYILRASGTDSTNWVQYNNQWPLYIRMSDNHAYFGGNVYSAGTLLTGSSDLRLKKNLVKIQTPLEKISKLTGYNFDWNDNVTELGFTPDTPTNDVGLIAQDVQEVAPQAVQHAPFDKEYDKETETHKSRSGEKYLTVQYEKLVPLLVEAIKELKAEVDALKSS